MSKLTSMLCVLLASSLLAGCGGAGGSTGSLDRDPKTPDQKTDPKTDKDNPSFWNAKTDGVRFATSLKRGNEFVANGATTAILTGSTNGTNLDWGQLTISQDDFGGLRTSYYDGRTPCKGCKGMPDFIMRDGDKVAGSEDAWSKQQRVDDVEYSMSLWNAGKGHREGLAQSEEGQSFHKIIGYYIGASTGTASSQRRGHAVIGVETNEKDLKRQSRTATYDGYYFLNAFEQNAKKLDQPNEVRGGLELKADFDKMKISGRSKDMEINTGSGFSKVNKSITLKSTDINVLPNKNYYDGEIASDFGSLDKGRYRGSFYGGNANETAGTITSSNKGYVTEGFFTTVRQKKK